MTAVEPAGLAAFLAEHPPFEALGPEALDEIAHDAHVERFDDAALIHDGFKEPTDEVFVVVAGQVAVLWNDSRQASSDPDDILGPGDVFGFRAMLTGRSLGPRAVACGAATVARIPAALAGPAFATRSGARFLVETMVPARRATDVPSYSSVDDLIEREPLLVDPDTTVGEVARWMTDRGVPAVVDLGGGRFGLITDAVLRARVLVDGRSASTPASEIMDTTAPVVHLDDTAAEALMLLLERDAEFLLVTDRAGVLRGVVVPPRLRHLADHRRGLPARAAAPGHEHRGAGHLRRPGPADARRSPVARAGRRPGDRGVLGFLDTIIRRAIGLVFARHPELSVDAFTWLSLGSNGRREAVLSSDVDSAVAFDDAVDPAPCRPTAPRSPRSRGVLATAGLSADGHGTTAQSACSRGPTPSGGPQAGSGWRPGRAQGRDHDLAAGGRPPHPRRSGSPCGEPRVQRTA